MQRLLYSIFISFFLILSCAKSKPSGVLSEKKIAEVFTEVALVDSYLQTLPSDSAKRVMPVLYDKIFKEFDLDSASFVKNLDFYYGNPNLTEKIYGEVGAELSVYEREFQVEDSIRMVKQNDSIHRANYFQRIYSRTENLRHYNSSDTGYKNYHDFTRRLLDRTNIDFENIHFNLSPTPDLRYLNKDSIASFARRFKSPFVYIDTAAQKSKVIENYKLNSENFLYKLKINQSNSTIYPTPVRPVNTEIMLDRGVQPLEMAPVLDTSATENLNDSIKNQIEQRRIRLRNDRMVKPVTRELVQ